MINIKQAFSALQALLLTIGCVLLPAKISATNYATTVTVSNIRYGIIDYNYDKAEVYGCSLNEISDVVIPRTVAFEVFAAGGYDHYEATVCSVASLSSKYLRTVELPNSVTTIGDYSFSDCVNLESISLPSSLTTIGYRSFWDCRNLKSINLPNSLTSIGEHAFEGCDSLKSLALPVSMTAIGNRVFENCYGLSFIDLPESLTTIGEEAFQSCYNLNHVVIPESVTEIGELAFSMCGSLTDIKLPSTLTSIPNTLFGYCVSLKTIDLPKSLKEIVGGTFYKSGLTEIVIPETVTVLGYRVFECCDSLKSVYLPRSAAGIGDGFFSECTSLPTITIPSTYRAILEKTFYNCTSLKEIYLGSGIESIGENVFLGTPSDANIHITALTPPDISMAEIPSGVTVYVDPRAVEAYKADTYWGALNIQAMTVAESLERGEGLEETLYLSEGEQKQLAVDMMPSHATVPHIFWYSTNPEVASVDINGLVTYHGKGDSGIMTLSDDEDDEATADSECRIVAETMYHEGPTAEFIIKDYSELGGTNSIDDITLPAPAATDAPATVYNLQGIRVSSDLNTLPAGIYIVDGMKQVVK